MSSCSALQLGKSKLGSILPEQITSSFILGKKVEDLELENLEREKYEDKKIKEKDESSKESVLRERRNIMNKTNIEYNLPTAEKLIKPVGSNEHAGKTTSKNVMSKHAVNLR